ncbi:hypothetical protein LSH36_501g04017 [Paralvinella palmiformis]|uniref:Innexin n=1 Tax=Paralvinella palmiformis TaxID=53620 RepID=A0AAD9J9V6_9ANNE|nr:hypothetical protein LSH36_501g04017 [Paralvinella palmiformis]
MQVCPFAGNHETYANLACWVSNTYYLPTDRRIPLEGERRQWINYYQWLPFILIIQAILYYIPCLVWRAFNSRIGVRLENIVDAARNVHGPENKAKSLLYIVRLTDRYLGHYRRYEDESSCINLRNLIHHCGWLGGKRNGSFLAVLYIFCKILYFVNCLGQLFMMDKFLGTDYHFYGFHALKSAYSREEWPGSTRFPIFTICDYKVRQMGHNIHRNTLQCVLPINFFNDKLYLGLWFWYVVVLFWTAINFVIWIGHIVVPSNGVRYIWHHMKAMKRPYSAERKDVLHFTQNYLRADGILIVRLIQMNASDIVASEVTAALFGHYQRKSNQSFEENRMYDNDTIVT